MQEWILYVGDKATLSLKNVKLAAAENIVWSAFNSKGHM